MLWNGLSKTLVYSPWGKYPVYDVSRPKRARRQPHASVTRHTAPATPHPDGRTLEADACPALRRFSFHRIQTRCRPNDWPAHISACRCRTASHTATAQNGIHRCKRPAARTCCPRDFALWPPFWVARMPASSPLSELDTVDRRPSTVVRRPSSVLHHHHQSSTIFLPGHAVRAWSLGRNAGTRLILPMMCMLATPPRPPPPPHSSAFHRFTRFPVASLHSCSICGIPGGGSATKGRGHCVLLCCLDEQTHMKCQRFPRTTIDYRVGWVAWTRPGRGLDADG